MKVLVVDDHALFLEGMKHVLMGLAADCEVLVARHGVEALKLAKQYADDLELALVDLHLPSSSGFDILTEFVRHYPTVPVIILSASDDIADIERALKNGAMGYITKSESPKVMLKALSLVLAGGIYIPPQFIQDTNYVSSASPSLSKKSTPINPALPQHHRLQNLSSRQLQILRYMSVGLSNKAIANKLCVSEATVKCHATNLFRSLGVENRTQAALIAKELDLLAEE